MSEPIKVFISYSHQDADACARIDDAFAKQGNFDVWYDKGLVPGEVYRRKIAGVIREADCFIILISNSSITSEWVIDEVEYAKKLRKKIIPIFIENVDIPDDLDMILQRYHSLFWHLRSNDAQFEHSLMTLFDNGETQPHGQAMVGFGNQFSESVNRQMKELLDKEKQLQYDVCYSPENAVILGTAYLYGGPCSVDLGKARHYFRAAEYNGSKDGEFYLLQMKMSEQIKQTWDDPDEEFRTPILERINQLADEGSVPAKLYLANLYWYGRYGMPKDMKKSAALYEECARAGNARAQFVMSANYYSGDGVKKDYELAKMYANLALEQRYIYAWRRWGKFYRDGLAVPQDYSKARECYENGAKVGDFNCYNKIGDMLWHGWGCDEDKAEAVRYFREGEKAPAFGQAYSLQRSKMALGRAYERGEGVEKDLAEAAQKYLDGYENGSIECRDAYLRCSRQLQESQESAAAVED